MMNFFWSYQNIVNPIFYPKYGALYNLYAVTDSRLITSSNDWVVPYYTDLNYNQINALFYYLGGATAYSGKLKEIGTVYFDSPNTGATNEYGFNGRGSGRRLGSDGSFIGLKQTLSIHSTFTSGTDSRQYAICEYDLDARTAFSGGWSPKKNGCAIRLLYTGSGTPTEYVGNDGKIYRIIKIGTQYWLADNLAETQFRNGDYLHGYEGGTYTPISNTDWAALTTEGMCVYNDDLNNM